MSAPSLVPMERVRELSRTNAPLAIAWVAAAWSLVIGAIVLNKLYGNAVTTLLVVLFIGNQQHALLIQMHDAAHRRLAQRRWLNDAVGELFCAWPMFFRMAAYRENHRMHHQHANTALDPDFREGRFPRTREAALRLLIQDFLGLNTLEQLGELKRLKKKTARSTQIARALYYGLALALIVKTGVWRDVLLYWVLPLFTWLKVILRMRAIADHAGVETQGKPYDTRTVVPSFVDRVFLAPRNCSYHFGHHTYESVPWFNLKKLHAELMRNDAVARQVRITRGFHRLLSEIPSERDKPVAAGPAPGVLVG